MLSCFKKPEGPADPNAPPAPPKKEEPPFVIMHESRYRVMWDLVIFLVVMVSSITVPLRIGFILRAWKEWLAVDIAVDLFFVADIVVHLLTTFELDGELVRGRTEIFWRYFKSWFWPDVLSVLPLELIAAGLGEYYPFYRVNRLLRIARLVHFFVSWEKVSSLKPSVIRIFKSAFVIVFLAHFIGCCFHLVIMLEGSAATSEFTGTADILSLPLASRYFRAYYWAFVTMTGYNNTNPTTQVETVFCIFVTMIGISLFATIIGTVGSLVTNLDSSKLYFRQKMDSISDYMKYKRIPMDLQVEVHNYYSYLWKSGKGLDKNKVLEDLPPYLKNKINVFLNSEIIKKVPLFQQCKDDQEFITEIVVCLKARVCLANSFVVRKGEMGTEMYFISRGELNVVNEDDVVVFTLKDGGFFGEIALLYDTKRTASIVARTYCDMFILTKEDFKKVMKKFPTQSKGIKEIAKERFQNVVDAERRKEEEARRQAEAAASAEVVATGGEEGQEEPEEQAPVAQPSFAVTSGERSGAGAGGGGGGGAPPAPAPAPAGDGK